MPESFREPSFTGIIILDKGAVEGVDFECSALGEGSSS